MFVAKAILNLKADSADAGPKYLTEALGQFQHNPANVHVSFYDHRSSFVEVSDVDREVPRPIADDLPIS